MSLAPAWPKKNLKLRLQKDLVRNIKRGHPWVYDEALEERPVAAKGSWALLRDKKGNEVAYGFYDADSQLAFRACVLSKKELHTPWVEKRLASARASRGHLIDSKDTSAFRLVNGEGDGLPGLVIDVYGDTAVLQLDGEAASNFWNKSDIAQWVVDHLDVQNAFFKPRRKDGKKGEVLAGVFPDHEPVIQEHGAFFSVDVVNGQKTGFFIDQRENRLAVRQLSQGKRVLNVFGYTGGFSVNAGLGDAAHVTTVDLSPGAIEAASRNWNLNGLDAEKHAAVTMDAFDFLEKARTDKTLWDLVIVDPPSFAPSKDTVQRAVASYTRLFTDALWVTEPGGLFCPASCSSHISQDVFLEICTQAFSKARRRAQVLGLHGQPEDHPYPLACPELRYLKFAVFRVS